jgi:sarcosine oxidase subunit gamma
MVELKPRAIIWSLDKPGFTARTLHTAGVVKIQLHPAMDAGGLHEALEVSLPDAGHAVAAGPSVLAWMAPNEWLIYGPADALAALHDRLTREAIGIGAAALAIDISHGRTVISLEGPGALTVLGRLCPVDLSAQAFPTSAVLRTMIGDAAAFLHCVSVTPCHVTLIVDQSAAPYVLRMLELSTH